MKTVLKSMLALSLVLVSNSLFAQEPELVVGTLTVEAAKLDDNLKRDERDKLDIKGVLELGVDSDGINPIAEDVIVTVSDLGGEIFAELIPAGSFKRDDDPEEPGYVYRKKGKPNGIKRMDIRDDGSIRVQARRFDLGEVSDLDITIEIMVGDDVADETNTFSEKRKGKKKVRYQYRRPADPDPED